MGLEKANDKVFDLGISALGDSHQKFLQFEVILGQIVHGIPE